MQTIYYTVGLPASGKSSLAAEMCKKDPNLRRVNKDNLRNMVLNGEKWSGKHEATVIQTRDALITTFLGYGHDVIVDDTNFGKNPAQLEHLGRLRGARVERIDLTHVSYDVCVKRDALRPDPVGEQVIRRMWDKYLVPPLIEPVQGLPNAVIVDMDGTLAEMNGRSPYSVDAEELLTDTPRKHVINTVRELSGYVFVFSARKEQTRDATMRWLLRHAFNPYALVLREDNDNRKDVIVKQEMYEEHIKGKYNVRAIFDDRPQVCRGWKLLGLPVFDVGNGVEF